MRTEAVKVFKFEELNEQAKEVARQWWKDLMSNDFQAEADMMIETMCELAKEKGIEFEGKNPISFDLSYGQGDYVGLNKVELKKEKVIEVCLNALHGDAKEMFKFFMDKEVLHITNTIDYHHYYGQQIEVIVEVENLDENELKESILDKFVDENYCKIEEAIKDYVEGVCSELKSYGYREIEHLYSNESVDEMITINEYEFTEDGKRW